MAREEGRRRCGAPVLALAALAALALRGLAGSAWTALARAAGGHAARRDASGPLRRQKGARLPLRKLRTALASAGEAGSETGGADAVEAAQVVSVSRSRPAQLLHSDGVQTLVRVLTMLKDAPGEGSGETALTTVLRNAVDSAGEIGSSEVPESFVADVDEAVEAAGRLMNEAAESLEDGLNWRKLLEHLSRLRLAQRLPEVVDEVVPWESVFPASLSGKTGVERSELRHAVRSFAREVDLRELAGWSDEEFGEAEDLIQQSDVLKEVYAVAAKAVEGTIDEFIGTAGAVAGFVAFVPFALAVLAVSACLSLLDDGSGAGGGGVPATGLSAENLGVMPIYKLGGVGAL